MDSIPMYFHQEGAVDPPVRGDGKDCIIEIVVDNPHRILY
jgi:hypothetical protein